MELKKYWKYILLLFLIIFIAINWAKFSWLFNYRVVTSMVTGIFEKKDNVKVTVNDDLEIEEDEEIVLPNQVPKEDNEEKDNTLKIPSIDIVAPIIFFDKATSDEVLHNSLDYGTVHYPGSVLPGEIGQTIILGHSAPANWPKIKYDWVFSEIESLKYNEKIIINFANEKYTYAVREKIFLDKGEEVPEEGFSSQDTLALISCWPPGKNIKRIVVIASLIK